MDFDYSLNINKLNELTNNLKECEKSLTTYVEIIKWESQLPLFEKMMLHEYIKNYKAESLGISKEEYIKYEKIYFTYEALQDYYKNKVPEIKKQMEAGYGAYAIYDINLTLEEACKNYCQADIETCQKINSIIKKADEKAMNHEIEIKNAYQGDLSSQLGINKEIYIQRIDHLKQTFNDFGDNAKEVLDNENKKYEQEINPEQEKNNNSYILRDYLEEVGKKYQEMLDANKNNEQEVNQGPKL